MPVSWQSDSSSDTFGSLTPLLQLAKQGDVRAAEQVFTRYRPYLRVVCSLRLPSLCQRREDASDIVQLTLVDAARGIGELRGATEPEFEAWMARLLERNILQSLRRHTADKRDVRRETIDWRPTDSAQLVWHSLAADQSGPEESVFRGEAALQLAAALERLPEDQRTAVEMRYLGQHSLKSIADSMSKSTGAVAGLIRRGIEQLRNGLPADMGETMS
jgi:RNA polymerase sigma-70 factor (ECF subfamily)